MNRTRKSIVTFAALGSVVAGGSAGLLMTGHAANAADTGGTTSTATADSGTTSAATATAAPAADAAKPASGPHAANGITETPLTGDDLAKATAAAQAAAPGSTVVRAETDADGDAYEVHITQADGTRATVKLNSDFSLKAVETDQGRGGRGGCGGAGGGGRGARGTAPAAGSSTAPATAPATTPATTAPATTAPADTTSPTSSNV